MNIKIVLKRGMALAMTAFTAFSLITMTGISAHAQEPTTTPPPIVIDLSKPMLQSELSFNEKYVTFIKHVKFNYVLKLKDRPEFKNIVIPFEYNDGRMNEVQEFNGEDVLDDASQAELLKLPEGHYIFNVSQELDKDSVDTTAKLIDASKAEYELNVFISSDKKDDTSARVKEISHIFIEQTVHDDGSIIPPAEHNKKSIMIFKNSVHQQLSSLIITTNTMRMMEEKDISDPTLKWAYKITMHMPDAVDTAFTTDHTDVSDKDGNPVAVEGKIVAKGGVAEIYFKLSEDDGPLTFSDLPTGTIINMTQTNQPNFLSRADVYAKKPEKEMQYSIASGEAEADEDLLIPKAPMILKVQPNPLKAVFTNVSSEVVPTGIFSNILPFILIGFVACVGIISYIVVKKKMKNQA